MRPRRQADVGQLDAASRAAGAARRARGGARFAQAANESSAPLSGEVERSGCCKLGRCKPRPRGLLPEPDLRKTACPSLAVPSPGAPPPPRAAAAGSATCAPSPARRLAPCRAGRGGAPPPPDQQAEDEENEDRFADYEPLHYKQGRRTPTCSSRRRRSRTPSWRADDLQLPKGIFAARTPATRTAARSAARSSRTVV